MLRMSLSPQLITRRRVLGTLLASAAVGPAVYLLRDKAQKTELTVLTGRAMGTRWRAVIDDSQVDSAKMSQLVSDAIEATESPMSTYRAASELTRFNATASLAPFSVSSRTVEVLLAGRRISARTAGAFDFTVGPLVDLWGFGPKQSNPTVGEAQVSEALAGVGWQGMTLDVAANTVTRSNPATRVDLSGIAKGYAVDSAVNVLHNAGVRGGVIELGGEVRCFGQRVDGRAWRVGVERPQPGSHNAYATLDVQAGAVATSGTYRNFAMRDGRRMSHVIDPRSGYPVEHDLTAVTVVAPTCMNADAWSTALLVLGLRQGLPLAEDHGVAALFITANGGELRDFRSPAMADFMRTGSAQEPS